MGGSSGTERVNMTPEDRGALSSGVMLTPSVHPDPGRVRVVLKGLTHDIVKLVV